VGFQVAAVVAGLALLAWGIRAVKSGDAIVPPPNELAVISTTSPVASPSGTASGGGVRHQFVMFPSAAVLGDSFATGYGTDRGRGWVEQLGTDMCWSIDAKSAELETGYTTPGGSATTSMYLDRVEKLASSDPDVVLVEGGVFDFPAPSELIYKNATDVFQLLRSELPETTDILVIGPVGPPAKHAELDRITADIGKAARDTRVTFIDPTAEGWLPDATYFLSGNNIQPNDRGHSQFAKRLAADLRERGIPSGCP